VKATLDWVAAPTAVAAEIRLYDNLFVKPDPDDVEPGKDYLSNLILRKLKLGFRVASFEEARQAAEGVLDSASRRPSSDSRTRRRVNERNT
jgi:hypothetical protein